MAPKKKDDEEKSRIAIVDVVKCKPQKCGAECKRSCPVVRQGKECIKVKKTSKTAFISEMLCIGCGICVKKCPYGAIQIINLPKNLESATTHRYGPNSFKLHRLPQPRAGQVLGLVGSNGTGKSTAMKILAGKLKPNLGLFVDPPSWADILAYFRGNEITNYLKKILEDSLTTAIKPQYVDQLGKVAVGTVEKILRKRDEREKFDELVQEMELTEVLDREVEVLSGGELQRFAIAVTAVRDVDCYMFDEPSSYLDVRQRLKAAGVIRKLALDSKGSADPNKYVVAIEHDLAVLDYLSDFVCCLYGAPGVYGVVTLPFAVREGINVFLAGYIPTENMRFRNFSLDFKAAAIGMTGEMRGDGAVEAAEVDAELPLEKGVHRYPAMTKELIGKKNPNKRFKLSLEAGEFRDGEIVVLLGENGMGKTTFIRILAGMHAPDPDPITGEVPELPELTVSYKPQKIAPKFPGSVRELLHKKIPGAYHHPQFVSEVMKPLSVEEIMDNEVVNLSGGELQRLALVLCLGKPADVYLLDEPSAYLDSEQRIIASRVIKKFIVHSNKTCFVVEHDFIMGTYLADSVVVYSGTPAVEATARSPQGLLSGMNEFLSSLDITFRRDPTNYRPRINKPGSVKDQEQKKAGAYFFLDESDKV